MGFAGAQPILLILPEHPREDRVDRLEVVSEVEIRGELGVGEILAHLRIGLEQREEIAALLPCLRTTWRGSSPGRWRP